MCQLSRSWVLLFILLPSVVHGAIPASQRSALIAIYNGTDGPNWWDNTNWLSAAGTEHTWFGVTVQNDTVVELILNGNNLTGVLPTELGDLPDLEVLNLGINNIQSPIPTSIANLTQLTLLDLYGNQFSEPLPVGISSLTLLETLYLGANAFSGNIPTQWSSLVNLEILWLNSNFLNGPLSGTLLSNFTELTQLRISYNQFTGSIPPEIGSLSNLQSFSANNNQFDGAIPAALGQLNQLAYLSLGHNQLDGAIPAQLGQLTSLQTFTAFENDLTGNIPAALGNLSNLLTLHLASNQLDGPIPPELGNLTQLRYLEINDNNLSGALPAELANLTDLIRLDLTDNSLDGPIPLEFGQLDALWSMALDRNVYEEVPNPLAIEDMDAKRAVWITGNVFEEGDCHEINAIDSLNLPGDPPYFPTGFEYNPLAGGSILDCTGFFPIFDPTFKAWLVTQVDTSGDDAINEAEAAVPTVLDFSDQHIRDIRGLESFPNLVTVNASMNRLTSLPDLTGLIDLDLLDVRHNFLEADDCPEINALITAGVTVLHADQGNWYPFLDALPHWPQPTWLLTWVTAINDGLLYTLDCE